MSEGGGSFKIRRGEVYGPKATAGRACAVDAVVSSIGALAESEGFLHERLCWSCSGELVAVVGIASSGAPGDAGGGACG